MSENSIQLENPLPIEIRKSNKNAEGNLQVSAQQRSRESVKNISKTSQVINDRKRLIEKLRAQRNKTMNDLMVLEHEQQHLKDKIKSMHKNKIKTMERSVYTTEQKQKIKQILKLSKLDERRKSEKHEKIIVSLVNSAKLEQQQQKRRIERIKEEHKKQVERNFQTLEERKKARDEFKKETSLRMLQIKKRKYIHLVKDEEALRERQKQKQEHLRKLGELKQKFKINFRQIKEHDKNYKSILSEKEQQRNQKHRFPKSKSTYRKYEENRFSRILHQEQKQKIKEQLRKANIAFERRQKINSFQKYVREKFSPKVNKERKSHSTSPSISSRKALSHQEIINKGNEYLTIAKKLRKQRDDPRIMTQPKIVKYMDYLKFTQRKARNQEAVWRFKSLINTQQSLNYPEAEKGKFLIQEIQAKSKKNNDDKLIESIKNKIDLLRAII